MQKLTAQAFRDLLSSVRDSIASLKSCHDREVPNERRLLENVMAELREASPKRRDDALIERKVNMLNHAQETLDARPLPRVETIRKVPSIILPENDRVLLGDRWVSREFLLST